MRIEFDFNDLFHALSPVGCVVEALSIALLMTAMVGCGVAAVV